MPACVTLLPAYSAPSLILHPTVSRQVVQMLLLSKGLCLTALSEYPHHSARPWPLLYTQVSQRSAWRMSREGLKSVHSISPMHLDSKLAESLLQGAPVALHSITKQRIRWLGAVRQGRLKPRNWTERGVGCTDTVAVCQGGKLATPEEHVMSWGGAHRPRPGLLKSGQGGLIPLALRANGWNFRDILSRLGSGIAEDEPVVGLNVLD
jgi:hypothetical protein